MTPHLLPLSALHAAAPGVLDVVFRPDGDFKGAPPWAGPMTSLADTARHGWLVWRGALHVSVATADGHWSSTVEQWRERWALDLRIPTVAARLAGLCARAMGGAGDGWRVIRRRGVWVLGRYHSPGMAQTYHWTLAGWQGHNGVNLTLTDDDTPESVLAKLTLTLAPQVAALKS